jgi:hypothetical protein
MNAVVLTVLIAMAASLNAETLSFPSFQIEIPAGWEHSIESKPGNDRRSVVSLRHPDGAGSMKLLSYDAPVVVGEDRLRNMTNVDASIPLTWKKWGDYFGYQYDYPEKGSFYRQWWLVNERTMMLVTYQSDLEPKDSDNNEIDRIVRSITAKKP